MNIKGFKSGIKFRLIDDEGNIDDLKTDKLKLIQVVINPSDGSYPFECMVQRLDSDNDEIIHWYMSQEYIEKNIVLIHKTTPPLKNTIIAILKDKTFIVIPPQRT